MSSEELSWAADILLSQELVSSLGFILLLVFLA
jgi:hypothetical protein